MRGCYLEHLTWPEAERALSCCPVVVLPVGARTKEHGFHLPLDNDWLLAEYLARRVAARCNVLVAPTLQVGFYPAFLEYPGSVSLELETFRDLIVQVCRCHARHGARRFYALNTGLSTLRALEPAAEQLAAEGVLLRYTRLEEAWSAVYADVVTQPEGTHADEIETSMMLYIAPARVQFARAVPDVHPRRGEGPFTRDPAATRGRYSPSGSYGDPTRATRDKGRRVVEAIVDHVVAALDAFATSDGD